MVTKLPFITTSKERYQMFQKLRRKLAKVPVSDADSHSIKPILTSEELEEYHLAEWAKLDKETQNEAIGYLRSELPKELLAEVKTACNNFGSQWMSYMHPEWSKEDRMFYTFHFEEGMGIRNLLRTIIKDEELPTGNWDDYYIEALLRAAGCR